jgi:hypothetical protein
LTVSRIRLTPVGVASSTETMPTANTPAASLKSRRNARTVAANANARPIKLIATARPVSLALLAAASSELPVSFSPELVCSSPPRRGAATSARAGVNPSDQTAAGHSSVRQAHIAISDSRLATLRSAPASRARVQHLFARVITAPLAFCMRA